MRAFFPILGNSANAGRAGIARIMMIAMVGAWLLAVRAMCITDVWDETMALPLYLEGKPFPLSEVFARKIPVFSTRPIPLLLQNAVAHCTGDYRTALVLLRGLNAGLLFASVVLLLATLRRAADFKPWQELVFSVAMLFSASGLITAGWAANAFDAVCLFFLSAGIYFLLRRSFVVAAGFLFGLSLFAKETGVLVFPFVALLAWQRKITVRQFLELLAAAAPLVAAFGCWRWTVAPPGSAKDVHGFVQSEFWPSLSGWLESFWRQNLMRAHQTAAGWLWLAGSLVFLRDRKAQTGAVVLLLASGILYWGMTGGFQDHRVMSSLNFIPRLWLIPAALFLVLVALQKKSALIAALLIPILIGGFGTFRNHVKFQQAYANAQRLASARGSSGQFRVSDSAVSRELYDSHRDILYGKFKHYDAVIQPERGNNDN